MTPNEFENLYLLKVRADLFRLAFEAARAASEQVARATSEFDATDAHHRFWLTADGRSGFAIAATGELRFVFSLERGRGDYLVGAAVDRNADNLDCFEGHLSDLYSRHGFRICRRAPNWAVGGPDVVWMVR